MIGGRRSTRVGALAVPALVLALTGCTGGVPSVVPAAPSDPAPEDLAVALSALLAEAQDAAGSSGAVAGVWSPWAGGWESAVGSIGDAEATPVTTETQVRLGTGGTQAMTCDVVVALAEEGTVDLDADVGETLTSLPGIDGATLRQLCSHTSGLADFRSILWPTVVQNPSREWPTLELISAAQVSAPIAEPGASWADSATGPLLAGFVASQATGRSMQSLYDEYVVPRYGLTSTRLPGDSELELPAPAMLGFAASLDPRTGALQCENRRDLSAASPSSLGAAGGAVTDLEDLRRLAQGLAAEPAGEAMWADPIPQGQGRAEWLRAGLGGHEAGPLRGFSGIAPGFLTAAYSDPASGLTVAVAFNDSTAGDGFAATTARALAAIAVEQGAASGATGLPELPWNAEGERSAVQGARPC